MQDINLTDNSEALKTKFFCAIHNKAGKVFSDHQTYGQNSAAISDQFGMLSYEFANNCPITEDAVAEFVTEKRIPDPYIREEVTKLMQDTIRTAREDLSLKTPQP